MTFPKLTTGQKLKCLSLLFASADLLLAYGDKIAVVPGIPAWVAASWPFVLIGAGIVHKAASIFFPEGVTPTPAPLDLHAPATRINQ